MKKTSQKLRGRTNNYNLSDIVYHILRTRDTLQVYHWNTKQYSRHKASDELIKSLTENMDLFVETYLGAFNKEKIKLKEKINIENYTDTQISGELIFLMDYLQNMDYKSSDLMNIRDELLGDINQTLYLFTLR
jgi:hypothetical protein